MSLLGAGLLLLFVGVAIILCTIAVGPKSRRRSTPGIRKRPAQLRGPSRGPMPADPTVYIDPMVYGVTDFSASAGADTTTPEVDCGAGADCCDSGVGDCGGSAE